MMTVEMLVALGLVAGWSVLLWEGVRAAAACRFLEEIAPASPEAGALPRVSVVIAARDEEERIGECLRSLLAQDYPHLEIIVVDDASADGTPAILDAAVAQAPERLIVIRVTERPPSWLGKTYALHTGASRATGEILLFTDADVIFEPSTVARAVGALRSARGDMLCVFPKLELHTPGEKLFALGFAQLFFAAFRPHRVEDRRSGAAVGVGAFNMVRRSIYERIGGHRSLRLTVVDDMALGRLVKIAGGRILVFASRELLRVRWQKGLAGSIRGVEKNAFAGLRYSWWRTIGASLGVLVLWLGPWIILARRASVGVELLGGASLLGEIVYGAGAALALGLPVWYAPFGVAGVCLGCLALWRSALCTTLQRGIRWRGTLYPLAELRKYNKF
jgi:glycosyltransferase involved in cell wall biosynthesis